MPRKTNQQTLRERNNSARLRVIEAARKHFLSHGFRNFSMDDLADALGMSKKTIYALFPSKIDLIQSVLENKVQSVEADMEAITSTLTDDFSETFHRLLSCMQRHTNEIKPPFVRDLGRSAPHLFKLIETKRAALIEKHFIRILNSGRSAKVIRKDIPVRLIVEILLGATHAIINPAKIEALGITPQSGYRAIIDVVLKGAMLPRKK